MRYRVNYFLYALVFLAFDVETIFLFPWAVKFQQLGLFAFIEMIIFIAILLVGLWYAWKEGALKWY
jgi:NADH-quinone oxidoreductase subunit A